MRHTYLCFLIGILLCWIAPDANAQETQQETDTTMVSLRGRVNDEKGEPVSLCAIRIEGQAVTALASLEGKYNIRFKSADSVVVLYSMIGFETRRKVLKNPSGSLVMNIVMKETGSEMSQVVVADTRRQMGTTQQLNTKDLKRMPSTTGNAVEELVATQAGVSSHNELSSQYNVRGGSFDENCV